MMTNEAVVRLCLVVCLSLGMLACADGGTEPRLTEAARVEIELASDTLDFGDVATATATVYDGEGRAMPERAVSWRTSDAGVVQVTATGGLTATGAGNAMVTASTGAIDASQQITVLPRSLSVTTSDASVALYEMLVVELGMDAPAIGDAPIVGVVGNDTLWFSGAGANRIAALVVGVPTGNATLLLHLDPNHTASLDVTFEAATPVTNVEAKLVALQSKIDGELAEIDSLAVAMGEVFPGADFVRAIANEFRTWSDTASAEARTAVAQYLAVEETPQANMSYLLAGGQGSASAAGCLGSFSANGLERRFIQCLGVITLGIASTGVGVEILSICNVPATPINMGLCLSAITATVGGLVLTFKATVVAMDLPGMILDKRIEPLERWIDNWSVAPASGYALRSVAPLDVVSDARYALDTPATYRSVVSADRSEGDDAALMVEVIETVHEGWTAFRELVAGLPNFLRSRLPALAESTGPAPTVPAATTAEQVPAEYLSVANPSAHTTVQFNPADRTFVARLERGLESDFSFDLVYASSIDQFTMRVNGKVRIQGAIAVDGGDGQSGEAGAELPTPLVARITNKVTGAGVAGVTVRWTVVAGSGSISADSSVTDAQGRATVRWTLGESNDEQVVRASAAYADGAAVDGAPITFTAVTNWPYTLQLMKYHPIYEKMVADRTLTRGEAFTTPNGLIRHFRLLRDGQVVGGTQLLGIERHYFGDETAPLNSSDDVHVPDYKVVMNDVVNGSTIAFPLDVTLSNVGYRAAAGRTLHFYLASTPGDVRHLTLNADGTTVLTVGPDNDFFSSGSWTMSEGMDNWVEQCGDGVEWSKPAIGYAYVPGNTPGNYIVFFNDGTVGFNQNYHCPGLPDYMRWVIQ